jgi:alanyl-tRNA synthetase
LDFFKSKGHDVYPSGSLIPIDVTGRLDESLLFNGAGMVQFKPFFRGVAEPPHPRLTTAQKCVRTGDIDEVGDASHLTFFEMLGNFSFGDYFKPEAIRMSWEFLTAPQWLGLDPHRLAFTVFTEDDEAYSAWSECLATVGIDPTTRIFRLGEETNYWPAGAFSSGPPGPCGPNSEMFYWTGDTPPPTGPYTADDYLRDESDRKWLEIWNDVFIQFEWQGEHKNAERPSEGYRKTGMPELPFRSIDTGMGLERTAAVLSGKASVYDTDVFQPILARIGQLSGYAYGSDESKDVACRIIADHIRTSVFCIADGILPANNGRGYVLRRLIRRAVLKGQRVLGFERPFFVDVFPAVLAVMGDHYGELVERKDVIEETLRNEEDLFRRTVARGLTLLEGQLERLTAKRVRQYGGEDAFVLYDTFGFPLEVTKEVCSEAGFTVDEDGFEVAMREAQERSRGASGMESVYAGVAAAFAFEVDDRPTATNFVGYQFPAAETRVVAAMPELTEEGACTGRIGIALEATPFYAESGGQVGDRGIIHGEAFNLVVEDMSKQDGVFVHICRPTQFNHPDALAGMRGEDAQRVVHHLVFNHVVHAAVDVERRRHVMRNHTATHLAHAALRTILGKHVAQQGSLVNPEHLRFDFSHGKQVGPDELREIEAMVNEEILKNTDVITYVDLPIAEAKAKGAMALFGEKYGDKVRMVEIGEFSRELCGGTHVAATGEIGLFKIVSEGSAASGVRRIEAITGTGSLGWLNEQLDTLKQASALLRTSPRELVVSLEKTLDALKDERKKREQLAQQVGGSETGLIVHQVGGIELAIQKLTMGEPKDAQLVADRLVDGKPGRLVLVGLAADGKVSFVSKAGPDAVKAGAHAGNLVRELAKIAGGGGGGRPDFATAGGRDPGKFDEAIDAAHGLVGGMAG